MNRMTFIKTVVLPLACLSALASANSSLSKELKTQTVDSLAKSLENTYIFPDLGKKAAASIRQKLASGGYESLSDGKAFAQTLTADVKAVMNDAHFTVQYSENPYPKEPVGPNAEALEQAKLQTKRVNAGFEKVERLQGNVGYIKFNGFEGIEAAKRPAAAAMDFVRDTEALIIDLRQNGGGDPETVRFICSYFFGKEPVHLNSLIWRDGRKEEFWTLKDIPGERYLERPIYVLTSKQTGSAAEEFAYNLQNLKRATIIGSVTWGGANPGEFVRLSDHFVSFVPNGRAENPITKDNWEGKGVKPHIEVSPEKALNEAYKLALKHVISTSEPARKAGLERIIASLESKQQ